jgi:hypothetical protein
MKTAVACSLLGLLFILSVQAHPGSGIAVDDQGRVFFAAGPIIVMIEPNGMARTIVHDQKNERFYQLHHIQRAPDGGLVTASDMGDVIWRFTPEGTLSRFYPPANEDRALLVGLGGDPFAVDREGNVYAVNSSQHRFTQILQGKRRSPGRPELPWRPMATSSSSNRVTTGCATSPAAASPPCTRESLPLIDVDAPDLNKTYEKTIY